MYDECINECINDECINVLMNVLMNKWIKHYLKLLTGYKDNHWNNIFVHQWEVAVERFLMDTFIFICVYK